MRKVLILAIVLMWSHSLWAYADDTNTAGEQSVTETAEGKGEEAAKPAAIKYWKHHRDGWWWYKDPAEPVQPKNESLLEHLQSIKTVEDLKKEVERLKGVAIMAPTEENLSNYMYAQQFIMDKSSVFADVWRRVVWKTPDLDYSLRRPVNSTALNLYADNRKTSEAAYVSRLSTEGAGLFYFFSSTCPYCQAMAPAVRQFQAQYGMEVLPISMDGAGLPEFPNFRVNNGQAERLGVETVPALFLVSPEDKKIYPIGFGVMSVSDIAERINVILNSKPGQNW
jgi:conjugal transfer pilus assembly protein TraF